MVGMLVWNKEADIRGIAIREQQLLQVRLACAVIPRRKKTPDMILCRRMKIAAKRLQKLGVHKVILPKDFPWKEQLEPWGIQPVSTISLRQMMAADWVRWELENRKIPVVGARVAVVTGGISGAVVRTVTELALRHRYVMLKASYGGEELCQQLRREYGVSLLLNPAQEQLAEAEAVLLFDRQAEERGRGQILLYDESVAMPPLSLPPTLEDFLPPDAERSQILTVLLEAGVLRPGQIAFRGGEF